jgi:hypothetical protein
VGRSSDLRRESDFAGDAAKIGDWADDHFLERKFESTRKFSLTPDGTRLLCSFRYHADSGGSPECSSLRLTGEPGFFSLLIGSDFVVYRKWRALIFDSLILDFVITTEFIEIQKVK